MNLEQLMEKSDSIIDLEEKIKNYGYKFKNSIDYLYFLKEEWKKITWKRIKKILNSPVKEVNDLPTLTIEKDNISYHIHGIVHGSSWLIYPGWHPRKKIRKFISEKAESYHKPSQKEDYFYEQNFRDLFDLLRSQEIKDITNTTKHHPSKIPGGIFLMSPISLICIFMTQTMGITDYLSSKCFKKTNLAIKQKSLSDKNYQLKYAELRMAKEMPQPFDLERYHFYEKKAYLQIGKKTYATPSERSLYTAKKLISLAHSKQLKKVHYIGGLGHLTQISYFLKNPDYSFEKLDNYFKIHK